MSEPQLTGRIKSRSDTAMKGTPFSEKKPEPTDYSSNRLSTTTLRGSEGLAKAGLNVQQPMPGDFRDHRPEGSDTPSHAHRAFQWVSNLDRGAGMNCISLFRKQG